MIQTDTLKEKGQWLIEMAKAKGLAGWERSKAEARQIVDVERWNAAADVEAYVQAISWPRVGIVAAALAVLVGAGWILFAPRGFPAHPPPLPTAAELRVVAEADAAFNAERSRHLVQSNRIAREARP